MIDRRSKSETSELPKITLITGMSGMQIFKCLEKFKQEYEKNGGKNCRKIELIKFDSVLERIFYSQNPEIKESRQVWGDILRKTYTELDNLWICAFEEVKKLINETVSKSPNCIILLNIHSCYFHNRTQEYLSLNNLDLLKNLGISKVITFIDDVYEIHNRLTQPGGIYHDEQNPTPTEIVLRYIRLLDWRAKENLLSRLLAKHLDVKNYLFAIKHPYNVFVNLVLNDLPNVYLSHPISEVRRLEKAKENERVELILKEINDISHLLSNHFTTFLPTTIDEYRILYDIEKKETKEGRTETKRYFPVLTKRWLDHAYVNPKNMLYSNSGDYTDNVLWKKKKSKINSLHELLTAFADLISDQVTIRDYTLVEQSDLLVIYRPLFNGNKSSGVFEEFNYYVQLKKVSAKDVKCFIYCPMVDVHNYYIKTLEKRIQKNLSLPNSLRIGNKKRVIKISPSLQEKFITKFTDINQLIDVIESIFDELGITYAFKDSKTPLGESQIRKFKKEFARSLQEELNIVAQYRNGTQFTDDSCSLETFVDTIKKTLENGKINTDS